MILFYTQTTPRLLPMFLLHRKRKDLLLSYFLTLFIFMNTVNLYGQDSNHQQNILNLTNEIEYDSLDIESLLLRGDTYRLVNKVYLAMEDYEQLLSIDSSYYYAYRDKKGQVAKLNTPNTIASDTLKAIILDAAFSPFFSITAYEAIEEHEFEKAESLAHKALILDSMNIDAYEYIGYSLFFRQEYELSIPYFETVLSDDTTDVYSLNNLGSALANIGQREKSSKYYYKILSYHSHFQDAFYNLGNNYYFLDELDSALVYFNKAIEMNSENLEYYNSRGNAYLHSHKYTEAMADYRKAIVYDSSDARFYGNIALVHLEEDQYDSVLYYIQKAIEIDPHNYYQFYDTRARVHHRLGHYTSSNEDYFKATEMGSSTVRLGNIGWNYYNLKEYDKCIEYSEYAITENPTAWYAKYNIALSLLTMLKTNQAEAMYKDLSKLAPDYAQTPAKQDLINLKNRDNTFKKHARKIMRKWL